MRISFLFFPRLLRAVKPCYSPRTILFFLSGFHCSVPASRASASTSEEEVLAERGVLDMHIQSRDDILGGEGDSTLSHKIEGARKRVRCPRIERFYCTRAGLREPRHDFHVFGTFRI